ncbi:unnamed protein product, partial [Ranitomeya imitator]
MSTDNEALLWLAWLVSCRFGVRHHMLDEEPQLQKRLWVHPLLLLRGVYGHFTKLYNELRRYPVKFVAFCHLSIPGFDNLLHALLPYLLRQDTCMRLSISSEERLLVTLRFLAIGHSYSSIHFEFLLGKSTISGIVRSTCDLIWDKLKSHLMPQSNTQDWLRIAQGFMEATEFPNCIGALDDDNGFGDQSDKVMEMRSSMYWGISRQLMNTPIRSNFAMHLWEQKLAAGGRRRE